MAFPVKGPSGRSTHQSQLGEREAHLEHGLYEVWRGPLVVMKQSINTKKDNYIYEMSGRTEGFNSKEDRSKRGLWAHIIRRDIVDKYRLFRFLDATDRRRLNQGEVNINKTENRVELMEILATHIKEVQVIESGNQMIDPQPDEWRVNVERTERGYRVGHLVRRDPGQQGRFTVPIGTASPGAAVMPASRNHEEGKPLVGTLGKHPSEIREGLGNLINNELRPGHKIYGGQTRGVGYTPARFDTVITNNAPEHNIAIRISLDSIFVDEKGSGSTYDLTKQNDPNRFR